MVSDDSGIKLDRNQRIKICEVMNIIRFQRGLRKLDRGVIRRMLHECLEMTNFDELPVHIRKQTIRRAMVSLKFDKLPEWRKKRILNYGDAY